MAVCQKAVDKSPLRYIQEAQLPQRNSASAAQSIYRVTNLFCNAQNIAESH